MDWNRSGTAMGKAGLKHQPVAGKGTRSLALLRCRKNSQGLRYVCRAAIEVQGGVTTFSGG